MPSATFPARGDATVQESMRLITRFDDVAVMSESIQQRRRYLGVDKDTGPFREAQVRGDGHARVLVQTLGATDGFRCYKRFLRH
jgi:hypothetical protein